MNSTTTFEDPPLDVSTLSEQDKNDLLISDTISISSETTLDVSVARFTPAKTLLINAKGISVIRISSPHTERVTSITNTNGDLVYTSTRAKVSSGSCTLTDADENPLIGTQYFFGPSKDPVLQRLDVAEDAACEITTLSKWTSRNHKFLLPDGNMWEWQYRREKGFGAKGVKGTALVLSVEGTRVAVLVRNDETRTLGSKSCSAGNGGALLLGESVGEKNGIEEELVVATCLLMLKKEIDRRRCVQLMTLGAFVI
ncbi:hypothetical protein OPT61_g1009 [Boeremia exigua]|uniref:Uncharacterized protein n=1 Tax=Boeremia exigua TaxID=749465 RepID=A0ACC2IRS3_9PLEO|nr:hypothetical protein OPT61_g1009 [Boeremia exigua]